MIRPFLFFVPVLFGLAIMLSSCSDNIYSPITKRHYRKGFDINIAHKARPAHKARAETAGKTEEQELRGATTSPSEVQNDENNSSLYVSADGDLSQFVVPHKHVKIYTPPAKAVKKASPEKPVITNVLRSVKKAKKAIRAASSNEDEALSLLWLIVVIVLILWLIAILAGGLGLGGLIHLLLLIALILLILWLLKVI